MNVRAAVAVQAGKPLEVMTVQLEGPRAGEVLIEVAAGICHTDDFRPLSPRSSRAVATRRRWTVCALARDLNLAAYDCLNPGFMDYIAIWTAKKNGTLRTEAP